MVSKIDDWDSREKPMNRGMISSQFHQYNRKYLMTSSLEP